jgi:phosphoribosylpyrophosphate synthetase
MSEIKEVFVATLRVESDDEDVWTVIIPDEVALKAVQNVSDKLDCDRYHINLEKRRVVEVDGKTYLIGWEVRQSNKDQDDDLLAAKCWPYMGYWHFEPSDETVQKYEGERE